MKKVACPLLLLLFNAGLYGNIKAEYPNDVEIFQEKIDIQQNELLKIEKEIKKYKQNVLALGKKEKRLDKELKESDLEIHNRQQRINSLQQGVSLVKLKIIDLRDNLKDERKKGKKYGKLLKETLKYYYFKQHSREILPWFTSILYNVKDTWFAEKMLVSLPARKYSRIRKKIERISNLKLELESQRKNLGALKKELVSVQNNFIVQKKKQLSLLKSIKNERENKQSELKNMQQEKERLSALITSLKKEVKNLKRLQILAEDFIAAKGELPWPVDGEVISKFGKQKHFQLDAFIFNRGIDIKPLTKKSNNVNAIAGGEIVYADSFEGLDNMVVIDHGNGYYTIYGKLKELFIEPGAEVEPMDSLGNVDSEVYFELGQGSKPQDPLLWLEKKGEDNGPGRSSNGVKER